MQLTQDSYRIDDSKKLGQSGNAYKIMSSIILLMFDMASDYQEFEIPIM